ncbi:hypothetical protein OROHE_023241 [Orobanche hederae]
MVAWENEVVMRDVTNAGLVISDHISREIAGQLDLEEALEASRYSSHPYSTHPREIWNLDEKIEDMVKKTCFAPFLDRKGHIKDDFQFKQSNSIITAVASKFSAKRWCFKFGKNADKFLVDFGLEDVLYISGLPIDGKQRFRFPRCL